MSRSMSRPLCGLLAHGRSVDRSHIASSTRRTRSSGTLRWLLVGPSTCLVDTDPVQGAQVVWSVFPVSTWPRTRSFIESSANRTSTRRSSLRGAAWAQVMGRVWVGRTRRRRMTHHRPSPMTVSAVPSPHRTWSAMMWTRSSWLVSTTRDGSCGSYTTRTR